MTLVTGTVNLGPGVPPEVLGSGKSFVRARVTETVSTASDITILPIPTLEEISPLGLFSIDVKSIPDGWAYVFDFVIDNGRYVSDPMVKKVPGSGTYKLKDLDDVVPVGHTQYATPGWYANVLTARDETYVHSAATVTLQDGAIASRINATGSAARNATKGVIHEVLDPEVAERIRDAESAVAAALVEEVSRYLRDRVELSAADPKYTGPHGRTGAAIQAALNDCPEGGIVRVPSAGGAWDVSARIIRPKNVSLDLGRAVLNVTASISGAVIDSAEPSSITEAAINAVRDTNFVIRGGVIRCNGLAQHGVRARYFGRGTLDGVRVESALARDYIMGSSYASEWAASHGIFMQRCESDRPRPMVTPGGSVGLEMFATDAFVTQCVIIGAETSFVMRPGAGSGHYSQSQGWARMPEGMVKTVFRVESSNQVFIDCMADTPSEYGWDLAASVWNVTWVGSKHFNNSQSSATDNVTTSVRVGAGCEQLTSLGFIVMGSAGKRILRDFDFGSNTITGDKYKIIGTSATFTTQTTHFPGDLMNVWSTADVDQRMFRNGVMVWLDRLLANGDRSFIARDNAGAVSHAAITMRRATRHVAVALGLVAPTNTELSPGQYALFVDGGALKAGWRPLTGDTSVQVVTL